MYPLETDTSQRLSLVTFFLFHFTKKTSGVANSSGTFLIPSQIGSSGRVNPGGSGLSTRGLRRGLGKASL